MRRAATLLLLVHAAAAAATQWTPGAFPDPKVDVKRCGRGGVASNICDPDLVLGNAAKDYIEGVLKAIWKGEAPYTTGDCAGNQEGYQARVALPTAAEPTCRQSCCAQLLPCFPLAWTLQVAVAVMRKMELEAGVGPAQAAKDFATTLHTKWGIGNPACNNGILFLLSIGDRQIYISTGKGAQEALSDARVASIIADIRSTLRAKDYDGAVERAVVDIGLGLAGAAPKGQLWPCTLWLATALLVLMVQSSVSQSVVQQSVRLIVLWSLFKFSKVCSL